MTQYWPYEQSEDLNHEVAILFESTKKKLYNNLSNNTYQYLYLDILDNHHKCKLFHITLLELEKLLLEAIDYNINYQDLKQINYQLLCNLILKIIKTFFYTFKNKQKNHIDIPSINYDEFALQFDHQLLFGNLITYLLFGSSYIDKNFFCFDNQYTPKAHISILLENFIIQMSNRVIKIVFDKTNSLPNLILFLTHFELCDKNYISIRTLICLKNNIIWQNLINKYINQPKIIYNSRYPVWLISYNGLTKKYIYTSRISDIKKLNTTQSFFLLIIEIQDLFIPKIEKILIILCKIILYIFINIIINSTLFLIKIILNNFNNQNLSKI
uniref:Uncharacterized protein n=1 Tax=Campylaephora sungminbooi TaxID=1896769 RepID=A0A1B0RRE7_9FLOR|nr:hypothetical protein BI106_gp181 [Campylaephora sungminbooi]AKU47346.1 hypothetical protein [Campylaephora sungminbooi]